MTTLRQHLLSVGIVFASCLCACGQAGPTNGLVSYYALDGTLEARFINAPIALNSTAQYATDRFGAAGKALSLNGTTYGVIQNFSATSFSGDFTTTFW